MLSLRRWTWWCYRLQPEQLFALQPEQLDPTLWLSEPEPLLPKNPDMTSSVSAQPHCSHLAFLLRCDRWRSSSNRSPHPLHTYS